MTSTAPRRRARSKGRIEQLPSGSLRVVVYAGQDPLTKRRHYLREIIPAGPRAAAEADKALRRLAVQVDEQRNPRTTATVEQLLTEHFELLEVEPSTLSTYRTLARTHIVLGRTRRNIRASDRALDAVIDTSRRRPSTSTRPARMSWRSRDWPYRRLLGQVISRARQHRVCRPASSTRPARCR